MYPATVKIKEVSRMAGKEKNLEALDKYLAEGLQAKYIAANEAAAKADAEAKLKAA